MFSINEIVYQTLLEIQNMDSTPIKGNVKSLAGDNTTQSNNMHDQRTPSNQIHNSPAPGARKIERDALKIHGASGRSNLPD